MSRTTIICYINHSPLLKNICVRQGVLDQVIPPEDNSFFSSHLASTQDKQDKPQFCDDHSGVLRAFSYWFSRCPHSSHVYIYIYIYRERERESMINKLISQLRTKELSIDKLPKMSPAPGRFELSKGVLGEGRRKSQARKRPRSGARPGLQGPAARPPAREGAAPATAIRNGGLAHIQADASP